MIHQFVARRIDTFDQTQEFRTWCRSDPGIPHLVPSPILWSISQHLRRPAGVADSAMRLLFAISLTAFLIASASATATIAPTKKPSAKPTRAKYIYTTTTEEARANVAWSAVMGTLGFIGNEIYFYGGYILVLAFKYILFHFN